MFVRVTSGYFLQDLLQLDCPSNRNLVFLLRGDRANERNRLTHRVLQKHRAEQHEGKIEKIHQRVAAGKSVVAVHGSPFVKIEPRECAAL